MLGRELARPNVRLATGPVYSIQGVYMRLPSNVANVILIQSSCRMDLHENKDTNTVTATFELPGLKKEDVNIDVLNGRLSVSGESKLSEERNEDGYAVRERRFGRFSRTLQLPQGVKEDEIKASMENGVLTVTFPKSAPEAAPKKITIA
jgi:HSP20 family protein